MFVGLLRVDRLPFAVLSTVVTLSCGSSDSSQPLPGKLEDLCAGAARDLGDGVATSASCPFIQQLDNISDFGQKVSGPTRLYDGSGVLVANVTHTCDRWALGTDPQGMTIIVEKDRGLVVSHGTSHPGQALSSVTSPALLPVQLR